MGVILLRAGKLPQPDRHHLHQPAFDPAIEGRMPLHTSHDHDRIGRVGRGIHEDFNPVTGLSQRHHVETTDDRTPHRLFGDSETSEDIRLSLRRGRAVTSHRWKNEGRHPMVAPVLNDGLDNGRDIRDATAADANRDARTGLKLRGEAAPFELAAGFCANIRQPQVRELLPDDEHTGWKHREQNTVRLMISRVNRASYCFSSILSTWPSDFPTFLTVWMTASLHANVPVARWFTWGGLPSTVTSASQSVK